MTLTPRQIELVQESFAKIAPISALAAELFYSRLFAIEPEVQPLFEGDLGEQGAKLMATLGALVDALGDLDGVLPTVDDLARRHVAYGVEARHYDAVGEALLFTLAAGLEQGFTREVREAWATLYGLVSSRMIAAAYPAAAHVAA